jgi:hypothetical protein
MEARMANHHKLAISDDAGSSGPCGDVELLKTLFWKGQNLSWPQEALQSNVQAKFLFFSRIVTDQEL